MVRERGIRGQVALSVKGAHVASLLLLLISILHEDHHWQASLVCGQTAYVSCVVTGSLRRSCELPNKRAARHDMLHAAVKSSVRTPLQVN